MSHLLDSIVKLVSLQKQTPQGEILNMHLIPSGDLNVCTHVCTHNNSIKSVSFPGVTSDFLHMPLRHVSISSGNDPFIFLTSPPTGSRFLSIFGAGSQSGRQHMAFSISHNDRFEMECMYFKDRRTKTTTKKGQSNPDSSLKQHITKKRFN